MGFRWDKRMDNTTVQAREPVQKDVLGAQRPDVFLPQNPTVKSAYYTSRRTRKHLGSTAPKVHHPKHTRVT